MNNLMVLESSDVLTMSSLEIAELTGKQHKNVLMDIRNMLNQLEIQSAIFSADYKDSKGRTYQCYNLPKEETICLIAGYNVQVRMRIIKRWQELEQKESAQFKMPKTLSEALLLAGQQAALAEERQRLLEQQKPKVEFVNNYVDAKGNKTFRGLVKVMNVNEREFRNWLHDSKIMYRLNGAWMPYSEYLHKGYFDKGYFEVKTGEKDGKSYSLCYFTPKGEVWIAEKWDKRNAVAKA